MESLQTMLDGSTLPVVTALVLGLLTAVSPCPLATNIAAVGYIGRDVSDRRRIFRNGLLYTLGRVVSYTVLGAAIITLLRDGASAFGVERFLGTYGDRILAPALILVGLFMLFGAKLNLRGIGINLNGERFKRRGGWGAFLLGVLFAMAFCPTSGVFYFGMLMPLSAAHAGGYFYPLVFAIATSLPVVVVAWILAYATSRIGAFYSCLQSIQHYANLIVGLLFVGVGIYYLVILLI